VLHLAAKTSVPRSVKDPIETNKINIDGTLNVLVAAKKLRSSAWSSPLRPLLMARRRLFQSRNHAAGAYFSLGVTKYVGELYGQRSAGVTAGNVALRYFNIFGPRQDPSSPYSGVLASSARRFGRYTAVVFGDGERARLHLRRERRAANLSRAKRPVFRKSF